MMTEHPDHGLIEEAFEARMQAIGRSLDHMLNPPDRPKEIGFVLLMFAFGDKAFARMNYLSNADRPQMTEALRELVRKFDGVWTKRTH